ncbi:hypothetical protein BHU72_01685 [Desulfuribacillus stibiiarsenatis]|uniref:Uncharacterized protein n=1 Tax=Desulfuribacillus stibiiarsenatis TaxID=1390249 RepID=A0A1E5LAH5_9FIRM|nr:hypothetical protein [Desulfuribacillus stibiiarsenatis]OEH86993.1 hypothetical protein BHU72_01685 [Desulfuribacillus stibiiarsenatis]
MSEKESWVIAILLAVATLTITDLSPVYSEALTLYYIRVGLLLLAAILGYFIINNVYSLKSEKSQIERWKGFCKQGLAMSIGRISIAIFIFLNLLITGGQYIFYGQKVWLTILSLQLIDVFAIITILGVFSLLASVVVYYEMERKYKNMEERN